MGVAAELMSTERSDRKTPGTASSTKALSSASATALVVANVDDASPAAKCGLKPGDVITAVGKSPVARPLDLERALLGAQAGEAMDAHRDRNQSAGESQPGVGLGPQADDRHGPHLGDAGPAAGAGRCQQLRSYQKQYRGGLLVTAVQRDSPAAADGIRQGDVLLGIHIWETISLENVLYILKSDEFATLHPVKFHILRRRGARTTAICRPRRGGKAAVARVQSQNSLPQRPTGMVAFRGPARPPPRLSGNRPRSRGHTPCG